MNNKVVYLIRTARYCGGFRFRPTRTYMLGTNKRKSVIQSTNLKKVLVNIPPSWLESHLQFLPQETRDFSTDVASVNEETARKTEVHKESSVNALDDIKEIAGDERSLQMKDRSQAQLFFEALEMCKTPCDVLDLLAKFDHSWKFIAYSFTAMWRLIKKMPVHRQTSEKQLIVEHPAFAPACQYLLEHTVNAWGEDLVNTVNAVFKLGVPQNSLLIQTLLRICQERLNELSDKCLSILMFTIKSMEKSKNIDALQLELRIMMEQRIPEIKNIDFLQTIMKHFGKDVSGLIKKEFENNVLENLHCLTSENAQRMFNTLAVVNYTSIPILDSCSKKIVATIHGTQFKRLNRILLACHILHYKNVEMFSAIENYVTSFINMWSIEQLILFLSAFQILRFRPTKLMDIVAENVIKYPESLNLKELMIIFQVYSHLNYVPKCQDQQFFEALSFSLSTYLPNINNACLLRAVYSFCVLGYHPQAALNHLMQKDVLSDLLKPDDLNLKFNEMLLHTVYVCLQVDGHSFSKPASVLQTKASFPIAMKPMEVQEVLQTLLGDKSMFRRKVQLEHGYKAAFEIKLDAERKKVLPVTETDDPADLNVQRVIFLYTSPSDFCLDMCPRGSLAMKMRHLKALGYRVILFSYPKFQNLGKKEAVEVLKEKIYSADN